MVKCLKWTRVEYLRASFWELYRDDARDARDDRDDNEQED